MTQTWVQSPSAAGPGHLMSVLSHGILGEKIHAQLPQGVCEQCAAKLWNEGAKPPPSQPLNLGPMTAVAWWGRRAGRRAGTLIPAHRTLMQGDEEFMVVSDIRVLAASLGYIRAVSKCVSVPPKVCPAACESAPMAVP